MKLDAGTIAALVVAGTGLVTVLLQWRSGAGRARTYNRLGQLLTMRGNVPDVLPSIRDVLDAEIVRVADRLRAVTTPAEVDLAPNHTEPRPYNPSFAREFVGMLFETDYASRFATGLVVICIGLPSTVFGHGLVVWVGIAFLATGLGVFVTIGLDAAGWVQMSRRIRRARMLAQDALAKAEDALARVKGSVPEPAEGGVPDSSGDVDPTGPAGTPLPRSEGPTAARSQILPARRS